jgi:hypothetical protein
MPTRAYVGPFLHEQSRECQWVRLRERGEPLPSASKARWLKSDSNAIHFFELQTLRAQIGPLELTLGAPGMLDNSALPR